MKYSQWIGVGAALLLIAACYMPWAWYPDLRESFTGFFSESNFYGRPGKLLVFFSVVAIVFFLIPRVWAKRANMLVGVLTLAFAIRCYFVYSACYRGNCPDKRFGIFLILVASLIMLLASFVPDLKLKEKN
jgi:hypothetical protein